MTSVDKKNWLAAALALLLISWTTPLHARGGYARHGHGLRYGHHYGYGHYSGHGSRHHRYSRHYRYGRHYGHRHGPAYYGYYRYYPYSRHSYYYGYSGGSARSEQSGAGLYDDDGVKDYSGSSITGEMTDLAKGWDLLSIGQPAAARNVFGRIAQANPSKGIPKVGYALASAELGELSRGVWAMRRALQYDPDALHYLAIDEKLRPKIRQQAQHYAQLSRDNDEDPDALFMLAALHYLLGDYQAAQQAIDRHVSYSGDTTGSAANLNRLISAELQS